jgi:flagellar hook-basal body complex protein FliE
MKIEAPSTQTATLNPPSSSAVKAGASGRGFKEMLEDTVSKVNKDVLHAQDLAGGKAAGEHLDIAQTVIESTKAELSFRLFLQVRNKVLNAYEEMMRMQF